MPIATRKDVRASLPSRGLRAKGTTFIRSECGIGALMPWADKLWITTYPDENGNGGGMGLWSLDEDGNMVLVSETNGTHAGRACSGDYAFIGEHKIHRDGTVIRMTGFGADVRITAWAKVPGQTPDSNGNVWVYALGMDGSIFRVKDSASPTVTFVGNAAAGLGIVGQPHFKAMWGTPKRLYVVSNINFPDGRAGYLDLTTLGGTLAWTRLDTGVATGASHIEVAGSYDGNGHVFALGQDQWTGFLHLIHGNDAGPARRFLIPLASRQQVKGWQQEWMRIRQADTTERYLMDFHGCYYALSPFLDSTDGNDSQTTGFPRLEALGMHTRTTTDFAVFDGKLWLGSNSSSTQSSNKYPNAGQSASILWSVASVDELLSMTRKPRASGAFYWQKAIPAATESEPMLARGYDKKVILIKNGTASTSSTITVYGYWGDRKQAIGTVAVAGGELKTFPIPDGVHPDWVSVSSSAAIEPSSIWMDLS